MQIEKAKERPYGDRAQELRKTRRCSPDAGMDVLINNVDLNIVDRTPSKQTKASG